MSEAAKREQETGLQAGQATQGVRHIAGGAISRGTDAVGQVTGLAGQTLGQVRQVTENPPGGKPVSLTTNESGRTVQRAVGTSGDIIEIILDENVDLVDETLLGSLADLPIEEEYRDEQGRTIRTVKEESGPLIEVRLGKDGNLLDCRILPARRSTSKPEKPPGQPQRSAAVERPRVGVEFPGARSRPGVLAPPPAVGRGLEDGPGTPIRGV